MAQPLCIQYPETLYPDVFRADVQITNPDVSEENESTTGAYIRKGSTRTLTIGIKDWLVPDTDIVTLTLSSSSNKISLYEGAGTDTPL